MKANKTFYPVVRWIIFIWIASSLPLAAQDPPVSVSTSIGENNLVTYEITGIDSSAHIFTLYGDGTFGNLFTPQHQFLGGEDYTTTLFVMKNYETIVPTIVNEPIDDLALIGPHLIDNPEIAMDGEVDIMTSWAPAAGLENFFIIAFRNESVGAPLNGDIVFHYSDSEISLSGEIIEKEGWVGESSNVSSELPDYSNKLVWSFADLAFQETRFVYVPATVNLATEEMLNFKVEYLVQRDEGQAASIQDAREESFLVRRRPHDPNFKVVNKTCIHPNAPAQTLEYTIGFFNDGDSFAEKVVLDDELSVWLNPATVESLDAEYFHTISLDGSEMTITFVDINLPGTNQVYPQVYSYDQAATYIKFSICTMGPIPSGDSINNTASITFDEELPINTSTATLVSGQPCTEFEACEAGAIEPKKAAAESASKATVFSAYPNPMTDDLTIQISDDLVLAGAVNLAILDYTGKSVQQLWQTTKGLTTFQQQFDLSDLAPGLYWLSLTTSDKVYTQKLIKQ